MREPSPTSRPAVVVVGPNSEFVVSMISKLAPVAAVSCSRSGGISGAIDLPSDATSVQLQISKMTANGQAGELVKNIDLGANSTGLVGFQWDGKDDKGAAVGASRYIVTATMMSGGKASQPPTDVYAPITEAPVPASGEAQTLKVAGVGVVKMSDIRAFKY